MATLANLGVLLLLMLTAFAFVKAVDRLHLTVLPAGDVAKSVPYVFSLIALLSGLATAIYKTLGRKLTWPALFLGSATVLLLLNIAAARWFAGGSYVLVWPLLAVLLAAVFAAFNRQKTSLLMTIALCLLALLPLVIFVPLLRGFYEGLGLSSFVPLLALAFGLLVLGILPLLEALLRVSGRVFPASMFFAAVLLFSFGAFTTRYSNAHPMPDPLTYALDADTHKALWAAVSSRVDAWTSQYLGTSPLHAKPRPASILTGCHSNSCSTMRLRFLYSRHKWKCCRIPFKETFESYACASPQLVTPALFPSKSRKTKSSMAGSTATSSAGRRSPAGTGTENGHSITPIFPPTESSYDCKPRVRAR